MIYSNSTKNFNIAIKIKNRGEKVRNKLGVLISMLVLFASYFLITKAKKNKTIPTEDIFIVYPPKNKITTEMIITSDSEQGDLQDVDLQGIDLYNEEHIAELARKQHHLNW